MLKREERERIERILKQSLFSLPLVLSLSLLFLTVGVTASL